MNISKILQIIETATRVTPAFIALAEEVIATFNESDQAKLKEALAAARARSDELHKAVQDKLTGAAGQ